MVVDDWDPVAMDSLETLVPRPPLEWLWDGYLMPGDITLLTSCWKTGKTTLLAGLLQSFATGTPFLGRNTRPAKVWVVSEETCDQWRERLRLMPIGPHVQLVGRPFHGRPSREGWERLIERCRKKLPDLFVVDPLASFLSSRSESEATSLLEALESLHQLTERRCAVLLLHHPRKKASPVGSSARGSGALLAFVDSIMELTRYSSLATDANRRLIRAQSRRRDTPERLAYEWNKQTGAFQAVIDPRDRQFEENWQSILGILKGRTAAVTCKEIGECWQDDGSKPSRSTLYLWMELAFERKLVRREGKGNGNSPWRYRLKHEDDVYYDRGELPPLRDLSF